MSPLFVRGRPVLKILYDSGLAPKCNMLLPGPYLRSCRTMFTERKRPSGMLQYWDRRVWGGDVEVLGC